MNGPSHARSGHNLSQIFQRPYLSLCQISNKYRSIADNRHFAMSLYYFLHILNRYAMGDDTNKSKNQFLYLVLGTYVIWVLATYFLEGRILTLIRPEAITDRIVYTIVANILIGILLALWVVRRGIQLQITTREFAGFRSLPRTIIALIIACVLGVIFFVLQHPVSSDPIILLNVYAQVFTGTVAEIAVCWVVVGATFEGVTRHYGRPASIIIGILVASVLFGVYHIGHSPPFNQPATIAFLSIIGVLTSLVYFIGRDVYATIVFHNFLGVFGVMQALSASGALASYRTPLIPLIVMAFISLIIFILTDVFYVRRGGNAP